ncbi:MAG: hypothetical protein ABIH99_00400 [Candidatus Micrarchaeota archaeon]
MSKEKEVYVGGEGKKLSGALPSDCKEFFEVLFNALLGVKRI